MRRSLIVVALVILAFTISALFAACAHEAPSGWQYPQGCCAGKDCKPIGCGTISIRPDGSAYWTGLFFTKEQIKYSGDSDCHVCVSYGEIDGNVSRPTRYPHCLFLSPMN